MIVAANGQRIDNARSLHNFEGLQPVGSAVALDVRRDGTPLQLTRHACASSRARWPGRRLTRAWPAPRFAELPERLRQSGRVAGVWWRRCSPTARAARSGLMANDVILAASTGDFADLSGFRAGFTPAPAELVLRIMRGNRQGVLQMQ